MFWGFKLALEIEFLHSFWILMIFNYLLTYDKNFKSEAHIMKFDLFPVNF